MIITFTVALIFPTKRMKTIAVILLFLNLSLLVRALPVITQQPLSRTILISSTANFAVIAKGTPSVNYQWRFGGLPLDGFTNKTLSLTNVQPAQAGAYSVEVSDSAGKLLT